MKNMTPEELLRDYISFHYVEGNITDKQRIKMEFAAANYLKELKALAITAVVQAQPEVCPYCQSEAIGEAFGINECFDCRREWS